MTANRTLTAWIEGWTRVWSAPTVLFGVLILTVALAAPLAVTMGGLIESQLGHSLEADQAADGVNWDWWQEFTTQSSGLGKSFVPQIIGAAATLQNLSTFLDRTRVLAPVAGAVAMYLLAWTFVSGGVIDRYARQRPTRADGFFAASGVFFFRFLRLGIVAGALYLWLFAYVHPWLFRRWLASATLDVDSERVVFAWRTVLYLLFGALLAGVDRVCEYARIRIVVEDRRSALGAIGAAMRFIVHHPGRVIGLSLLNALTFAAALALWTMVAPGAPRGGVFTWLSFLVMQLWMTARIALKLHFVASETALFQASLAHAAYTAAPLPAWPDSPAAEMIR